MFSKMNVNNLVGMLCLSLIGFGCGDANLETEDQIDGEFEQFGGKADNLGIDTATGDAILRFLNQPFRSYRDPETFEALLDSKLHRTAARNLVAVRIGPDGYLSGDDQQFTSLEQVDEVRYVGPVAIRRLAELAIENGYDKEPTIYCEEIRTFRTRAQLQSLKTSGCNIITTNVLVALNSNETLLGTESTLSAFSNIKQMQGSLEVRNGVINGIHMPKLESVGDILVHNTRDIDYPVAFPRLTSARIIDLHDVELDRSSFIKLQSAREIHLHNVLNMSFEEVTSLRNLTIKIDEKGAGQLAFSNLDSLNNLVIELDSRETTLDGRFSALRIEDVKVESLGTSDLTFDVQSVGNLLEEDSSLPVKFPALQDVDNDLKTKYRGLGNFDGFKNLRTVGGSLWVAVGGGSDINGFDKLKTVGHSLTVFSKCDGHVSWFSELIAVDYITWSNTDCLSAEGFDSLQVSNENLELYGVFSEFNAFSNLVRVRNITVSQILTGDVFPNLRFADRLTFELPASPTTIVGFDRLEQVTDRLAFNGGVNEIAGLSRLESMDGTLRFKDTLLTSEQKQAFIDQFTFIGGSIILN